MNIEEARQIWKGSDMSESELVEWVRLVNKRDKEFTLDTQNKGETITVTLENSKCQSSNSDHRSNSED
jgi:hypothetical protein